MPDGPSETPYGQELRHPPEREPFKILPVLFVLSTISSLYFIYTICHLMPMLQLNQPMNMVDLDQRFRGLVQASVFNFITLLLLTCYIRCILVHPGEVPNEKPWLYTTMGASKPALQEAKKSGERRHCKWCGKYKPDRCHHCRICKTCILKMDHHCPWIYNCVGFHNYKYFFLLLLYTVLDTHFIMWTMTESMVRAIDQNAPFMVMFFLLFGLTLAFFLGTLATLFFGFHVWLTCMGLTTIEFCEKKFPKKEQAQQGGGSDFCGVGDCFGMGSCCENDSPFNLGVMRNLCSVLGWNPLLWLLPFTGSPGDGLTYEVADMGRSYEGGRGSRKSNGKSAKMPAATKLAGYDALPTYGLQGYGAIFHPSDRQRLSMTATKQAFW